MEKRVEGKREKEKVERGRIVYCQATGEDAGCG
jgi:hypothetical protein